MAMAVIVHIHGEDAFLGEIDDLPDPTHHFLLLRNIRKKDGKPLAYVSDGATAFLYPWSRITFIETLGEVAGVPTTGANGRAGTTILGFFRDDERS